MRSERTCSWYNCSVCCNERRKMFALASLAQAWISTSQARFGATIAEIYNESIGLRSGDNPQKSLGYLWTQPQGLVNNLVSTRGLGGSITWASDERLCSELSPLFQDTFWTMPLVSCDSIKASLTSAFETWEMNSRYVKFTDVTAQCHAHGHSRGGCPYAEIWVASMAGSGVASSTPDPALARQTPDFTTSFRLTNGLSPVGSLPQQVAEVVSGGLSFRTNDICYYQDSEFCSVFHQYKQVWNSPLAVRMVGTTMLFTVWGIAFVAMAVSTAIAVRRAAHSLKVKFVRDVELDVNSTDVTSTPVSRLERALLIFTTEFSIAGVAGRLLLMMIPWPFFTAVRAQRSPSPRLTVFCPAPLTISTRAA